MSLANFLKAIEEYDLLDIRKMQRHRMSHAGNLTYQDDKGRLIARKTAKKGEGELRMLTTREKKAAEKRRERRKKKSFRGSGKVID